MLRTAAVFIPPHATLKKQPSKRQKRAIKSIKVKFERWRIELNNLQSSKEHTFCHGRGNDGKLIQDLLLLR